jgi:hypothetical protein
VGPNRLGVPEKDKCPHERQHAVRRENRKDFCVTLR